jgi:hypothetical protein
MKKVIILVLFMSSFILLSQRNLRDSIIGTPWIGIHYGGNWSKGDLAKRFGYWNHLGVMAGYKTNKNWFLGFDGNFMFTDNVKATGLFVELIDEFGNITDDNGDIAKVLVVGRGFNANLALGKVLPILSPNENSGIFIQAGVGYLLNKWHIETRDQVVPLIETDYRKGYDRLVIGYNFHQFIGYAFMASKGVVNFYAGFYIQEGFTKFKRNINFDQPTIPVSKTTLNDIQLGFRTGWFIPVYKRRPKDFYFN